MYLGGLMLRQVALMVIFGMLMTGCMLLRKPESPKVTLTNVDVSHASLTGATLNFHFHIENPNDYALSLDQIEYALALDGKPFTSGVFDKKLKVEGKGILDVPLPIQVEYKNVLASIAGFLRRKQTDYALEGSAKIGLFKIPFGKKGEVKMSDL